MTDKERQRYLEVKAKLEAEEPEIVSSGTPTSKPSWPRPGRASPIPMAPGQMWATRPPTAWPTWRRTADRDDQS